MTAPDQADIPDVDELDSDDLVAELDDEPDDTADAQPDDDTPEGEGPFTGACSGGPWSGRTVTVRRPRGFFLIDPDANTAWVYDHNPVDGEFECRNEEPDALSAADRWRVADQDEYDVLVLDAETDPAAGEQS